MVGCESMERQVLSARAGRVVPSDFRDHAGSAIIHVNLQAHACPDFHPCRGDAGGVLGHARASRQGPSLLKVWGDRGVVGAVEFALGVPTGVAAWTCSVVEEEMEVRGVFWLAQPASSRVATSRRIVIFKGLVPEAMQFTNFLALIGVLERMGKGN